ncbi:piRNA biogenesis protein EXD1 [Toxorhynchites rutilus septentrionalis]|uniref:piRNA biogenesis protein EXD1 n=1 Tax=Toxorhynchites rutilus septentrionalis TaxID=329112 RepID=UPI0024797E25|nr:piRNA biogenesis protein EXD1 [Toxorhynchites rutilus septentrionalis]
MDDLNLVKGQIVILDLEDECVIGEIVHIGSKRSFVRLRNVKDFQTNLPIVGTQDYYYSEIKHVKIVESESVDGADNELGAGTSAPRVVVATAIARINLEEVEEIFNRVDSHIFIHQTDAKYYDAIKYLKTQKLIALGMEGIELGRHSGTPSLLSMASNERIYVFDIKWMNVTSEMKTILASPKVRRVIHDGRRLEDALKHQCGATLGRYFDTLVAHISTTEEYDEQYNELTIQECLVKYLNLPKNSFDPNISFENRPLNELQRRAAAKNVAFLLTLQDYFVHDVMLDSFYQTCSRYGASLAVHTNPLVGIMELSKGRNDDLHDIERFKLDIKESDGAAENNIDAGGNSEDQS